MPTRNRCVFLLLLSALCIALGICVAAPGRAQTFTNPLATGSGDPFITYANGKYYLTITDINTSPAHEITVTAATSLGELAAATHVGVYNNGEFYESPKMYFYNGRWYITYTDFQSNSVQNINVLVSSTSDPQSQYSLKAHLTPVNGYAYDACLLTIPSGNYAGMYLLYSTFSALYIEALSNPYTVKPGSSPQLLTTHTDPWELTAGGAIEAPNILWHNGQLSVLYSIGIYNKPSYSVGDLRYNGGDPTVSSSWAKLPGPVFAGSTSSSVGVYDAGVADPFYSPDGLQAWFAYSDYNVPDNGAGMDPNRTILAQPLYFDAFNNPVLGGPIPVSQPIPLPSGDPNAAALNGPAFSVVSNSGGLVLDNPGGSASAPDASVLLNKATSLISQSWQLNPASSGAYALTNAAGGLNLNDPGGATTPGVGLQLAAPSTALSQQFVFGLLGDGTYAIGNLAAGLNLDNPGGGGAPGGAARLATPTNSAEQSWNLTPAPDEQGIVSGAVYTLTNVAAGINMDNPGGSMTAGTKLQLWTPNNLAPQNWRIEAVGNGLYTLTNLGSGALRLDDPSGSTTPGTNPQLWYANTLWPQTYRLTRQDDGAYTIVCQGAGLNIAVPPGGTSPGTLLQLLPASGGNEQEWKIQPAPNTDGIIPGASYVLVNQAGSLALNAPGNPPTPGAKLDLEALSGAAGQVWQINLVGNPDSGDYILTNLASGLNLDDPSGSHTTGTQAQLWIPNGQNPQEYHLALQGDGTYTVACVNGGLCLDNPLGSSAPGTSALLDTANGASGQKWVLQQVPPATNLGIWSAISIAVGGDGLTRILWTRADGAATIYTVNSSGNGSFGPIYPSVSGWSARKITTGINGGVTIWWTSSNGATYYSRVGAGGALTDSPVYGPYGGWTPIDFSASSDGSVRLLWATPNGAMSYWTIPGGGPIQFSPTYGPYSGWTISHIAASPSGSTKLLWINSSGAASIWTVVAHGAPTYSPTYGPYAGWACVNIGAADNGATELQWNSGSTVTSFWTLPASGGLIFSPTWGPFSPWTPTAFATAPDSTARLLWNNASGAVSYWTVPPSGRASYSPTFGPF